MIKINWPIQLSTKYNPIVCSSPCDIAGDISYEELRAAAYDDANRGLNLQSIVR